MYCYSNHVNALEVSADLIWLETMLWLCIFALGFLTFHETCVHCEAAIRTGSIDFLVLQVVVHGDTVRMKALQQQVALHSRQHYTEYSHEAQFGRNFCRDLESHLIG